MRRIYLKSGRGSLEKEGGAYLIKERDLLEKGEMLFLKKREELT
jgi:hypothetical protein